MCTHINDRRSKAQGEPRREALGRNKGEDLSAVTGRKKRRTVDFKRGGWRVWDPRGRNAGREGGRAVCEKGKGRGLILTHGAKREKT